MEGEQALHLVMHCSNNMVASLLVAFRHHLLYIAQQGEALGPPSQIVGCVLDNINYVTPIQPTYILFCLLCIHSID